MQDHVNYREWWDMWYSWGGTSGAGSYGVLAEFKAEVINRFISEHQVESVIEFGCGDGNQLSYLQCKKYLGLDVAKSALDLCMSKFSQDKSKSFFLYDPDHFINNGMLQADLVICLDVLYHIIEDRDYHKTLADIFSCKPKYVILYTITNKNWINNEHTVYRDTFADLGRYPEYKVFDFIPQKYGQISSSDFIILGRS